ncbi:MAG: nucleotidyltransferase family protein [Clostridia bacterium]
MKLCAVLLAAGEGKRFGELKQLAIYQGESFILLALRKLLTVETEQIIIVLGFEQQKITQLLQESGLLTNKVKIVVNEHYQQGMGTSIATAMNNIIEDIEAVMFLLVDLPLMQVETISLILKEFRQIEQKILVPTYQGKRGHPTVWGKDYFSVLSKCKGDTGARELLQTYAKDVWFFSCDDQGIILDIDTLEQLKRLRAE